MKNFKILLIITLSIFMIGCNNSKIDNTDTDQKDVSETSSIVEENVKDETEKNNNENKDSIEAKDKNVANQKDSSNKNSNKKINNKSKDIVKSKDTTKSSTDTSKKKTSNSDDNLKEKVKNYIINGQGNKSEAEKMKWSEAFLNKVDIDVLYKQYIANGGTTDNLEKFAEYITLNAPISTDWKNLFEKDLYDTYGEKVVRLEHLEGDLYQAYINYEGKEVPYVVVSSRTGYFHG